MYSRLIIESVPGRVIPGAGALLPINTLQGLVSSTSFGSKDIASSTNQGAVIPLVVVRKSEGRMYWQRKCGMGGGISGY